MHAEMRPPVKMRQAQATTGTIRHHLFALMILTLTLNCNAFRAKDLVSAIARPNLETPNVNLTLPMEDRYKAENELIKGVRLIESMKTASACKTTATQQLLSSCSALDGTKAGDGESAQELEKVKSQYAARLAVCELKEAKYPPKLPLCSSLGASGLLRHVDRSHLASCLRELQNDGVFWTSYTNNLQNVGYMCQVARADIEKEELIEQRRASLETTLLVTKVLFEFQKSVATRNEEFLNQAQKIQDLQRQNLGELETARKDTSAILHRLKDELGAHFEGLADKAEALVRNMTTRSSETNVEVAKAMGKVHHGVQNIWQMVLEGSAELAARQLQDSTESHEKALATQQALERLVDNEIGKFSYILSGLSTELLVAGKQVTLIHQGHVSLAASLNRSMTQSAHVADTLDKLNVPVLELFAKAASLSNFILSDAFLGFTGFFSPLAAIILCAAFFQFKMILWLLRATLLLTLSYVTLKALASWNSSPSIRNIFQGALQSTTTSIILIAISCACLASYQAGLGRECRHHTHEQPTANAVTKQQFVHAVDDCDGEVDDFDLGREKSLENYSKPREGRASSAPPC